MAEENGTTTETKTNNPNTSNIYTINGEIHADKIYYKNSDNKYIEYLNSDNIGDNYITPNQLNERLKNVATIKNTESSENSTYSSSKINELISNLGITITSKPKLLTFTKSENTWIADLSSDSKIITKNDFGNLKLGGTIEGSSLITISSISFKNNNNNELILKTDNNSITSNLEIILPSKAGTIALTKDIPSFEVDNDGYLNITTTNI